MAYLARKPHGHLRWDDGTCRLCGEPDANETYTCPQIRPRQAKLEAAERERVARESRATETPPIAPE
jgi:hypothetical protein